MEGLNKITSQICKLVDRYDGERHELMRDQYGEVINALTEICELDPTLDALMLQEHKSWERCESYMYEEASKLTKGNCLCVSGNLVMKWITDYFKLDDKAKIEEEKRKAEEQKKKVAEKKADKPTPEEDVEEEDEENEIDVEPAITLPEVKAPDRRVVIPKEKKAEKKNSDDLAGQTSIFDFMGV